MGPGAGEVFNFLKTSMKDLKYFDNFDRKFPIFPKGLQVLSNFSVKIWEKFQNMHLHGVHGRSPPELVNLSDLCRRSMETSNFSFETCMKSARIFLTDRGMLNEINGRLMFHVNL